MSAVEIIEQIRKLPAEEREKVNRFTRSNLEPGQLSGKELSTLAQKMVETDDPAEADRLQKQIIEGFYGNAGPDA